MNKSLMLGLIIVVVSIAALWVFLRPQSAPFQSSPIQTTPISSPKSDVPIEVSLAGEYLCLPHRDTDGPQTLECALGLKTNEGNYYALDFDDLLRSGEIDFGTGTRIVVSGQLVPIEQISSDQWQRYAIEGIIKVETAQQV